MFLNAEMDLIGSPPESLDDVEMALAQGIVHESHYLLFEVLENYGRTLANMDPRAALPIWQRVLRCVDRVLPR